MPSIFSSANFSSIRALLFDLDGTLVHSAPDLHFALNALLTSEGRRPLSLPEVIQMIGDGVPKLVERGYRATGTVPEPDVLAGRIENFSQSYEKNPASLTTLYPGVLDTLTGLQKSGFKLGLCTNKPIGATTEILKQLGIGGFFGAVIGGDSLDGIKKPDPRPLQTAIEQLGCSAQETIMIGDNHNDVASARNAGVPVIAVSYGYTRSTPEELGADVLIDNFGDLVSLLIKK